MGSVAKSLARDGNQREETTEGSSFGISTESVDRRNNGRRKASENKFRGLDFRRNSFVKSDASLSFNSVENDFSEGFGGSDDLAKWRIRTLIKQLKEYGVNEDTLFHEDDLLYSNNIPKVARCLKQVAIIAQNDAQKNS